MSIAPPPDPTWTEDEEQLIDAIQALLSSLLSADELARLQLESDEGPSKERQLLARQCIRLAGGSSSTSTP